MKLETTATEKKLSKTEITDIRSLTDLYIKILDSLPINVFLEDAEGRTLYANQEACSKNGLKMEELIGKTVYDFFPMEIAEQQRRQDLEVWRTRQLLTEEAKIAFQGKEFYSFSGKTIIHLDEDDKDFLLGFGLDITDRVMAEKLLKESEERFRTLVDQAADSFFLSDEAGNLIDVNKKACVSLGYTREELLALKVKDILDLSPEKLDEIYNQAVTSGSVSFEHRLIGKNNQAIPAETNMGLISYEDGKAVLLALSRDVTDRKKTEEQIEHMAYHDALTGLPNRWFIHTHLQNHLANYKESQGILAILLLDLDHFKVINDSLGHQAGDLLLQQAADRLMNTIRKQDILARLGGDEFIILLPNIEKYDDILSTCNKINRVMQEPFLIQEQKISISTSIGVSLYPNDGMDIHTLIKNADIAMYRCKDLGRNGYELFNPTMRESAKIRMELEIQLRKALENNEFVLHFQPKACLKTGRIYGMEALIRWESKERGLVPPGDFIQIAEETGLINSIGEWVLREACTECKKWHDAGLHPLSVSVNLSASQFYKNDLKHLIIDVLQETGLPPASLELELTESMIMKNPKEAAKTLQYLKKIGVSISIDDFGTGFSSLSYLKDFPIDILKIDRSFITNSESDETNAAITLAIITLAHSLKMDVVAEGVENEQQLDFLHGGKCDAIQGYLISRPLDPKATFDFLAKRRNYPFK